MGRHSRSCEDCVFSTILCGVELSDVSLESALDSFCFICMPIEPVQSDRSRIEQTKRALRVRNCFEISTIGSSVDQQLNRRVERVFGFTEERDRKVYAGVENRRSRTECLSCI